MPFTLTATHVPFVLVRRGSHRQPTWQRLRRVATAAIPSLVDFWRGIFQDVRQHLHRYTVQQALDRPTLLDVDQVLTAAWHRHGELPAREMLPLVLKMPVEEAAATAASTMESFTDEPVTFTPGTRETQQTIATYASSEVQKIGATTLAAARQTLQEGRRRAESSAVLASLLLLTFGLTPRQAQSLTQAEAQWRAEDVSERVIAPRLQQAVMIGLTKRVQGIGQTQAYGAVNLGHDQMARQVAGAMGEARARIRKYWIISDDERVCPLCRPLPEMHPDGIGLDAFFHTPAGELLYPPVHPTCRCTVEYRESN